MSKMDLAISTSRPSQSHYHGWRERKEFAYINTIPKAILTIATKRDRETYATSKGKMGIMSLRTCKKDHVEDGRYTLRYNECPAGRTQGGDGRGLEFLPLIFNIHDVSQPGNQKSERDISLHRSLNHDIAHCTPQLSTNKKPVTPFGRPARDASRHEYESIRVPSHANGSLGSGGASPWIRILTRPHSPSAATTLINLLHQSRGRASSSSPRDSRQDCVPPGPLAQPGRTLTLCLTSLAAPSVGMGNVGAPPSCPRAALVHRPSKCCLRIAPSPSFSLLLAAGSRILPETFHCRRRVAKSMTIVRLVQPLPLSLGRP